jgi:hypothetical protein
VKKKLNQQIKIVESELFASAEGTRPVDGQFVSALQIKPITGLDAAGLRRLADVNNVNPSTGKSWIPKPIRGKFIFGETLIGWGAWMRHQNKNPAGFPDTFATKSDFEAQTPFTTEMLDFARKKGCPCVMPGNRIKFRPFLEFLASRGIEQLDFIDGDYEAKRLTRAKAEEQERLNIELDEKLRAQRRTEIDENIGGMLTLFKKDIFAWAKRRGVTDELKKMFADHLKQLPAERIESQETVRKSSQKQLVTT